MVNSITIFVSEPQMFLFLLLTFVFACNNDEGILNVDRVVGFYRAIVFTEPGRLDGGVDILAKGGELSARLLKKDLKVEGYIRIPAGVESNFPPMDTIYTGTFALAADTLHIKNTHTPLDSYSPFLVKGNRLESIDKDVRWRIKMVLEKK